MGLPYNMFKTERSPHLTQMKLFTKIAIGSVAGIAALATIGNISNGQSLASCNAGNVEACSDVFDGNTAKKSMITNKAFLTAQANKPAATPKAVASKTAKLSNYEVCLKSQQDLIEFGGDPSVMDCKAVKTYRTPAQRIASAGGQQRMIRGCEAILKPVLNDPNSYRYLSGRITTPTPKSMNVIVNYTATNAFGGRVQNTYSCTTNG